LDDLIADTEASILPFDDAGEADTIAHFLAYVVRGVYGSQGEFVVTLSIPADIDLHEFMKSRGEMVYAVIRKC
jgi:hypothetical protein